MTIDYSKPILLPLTNGEIQSVQLNLQIPGHAVVAGQLAAIAAAQSSHPATDLRKFESLSEQGLIAKHALMKSGVVAGL